MVKEVYSLIDFCEQVHLVVSELVEMPVVGCFDCSVFVVEVFEILLDLERFTDPGSEDFSEIQRRCSTNS